jgi:hypothetical protein
MPTIPKANSRFEAVYATFNGVQIGSSVELVNSLTGRISVPIAPIRPPRMSASPHHHIKRFKITSSHYVKYHKIAGNVLIVVHK